MSKCIPDNFSEALAMYGKEIPQELEQRICNTFALYHSVSGSRVISRQIMAMIIEQYKREEKII